MPDGDGEALLTTYAPTLKIRINSQPRKSQTKWQKERTTLRANPLLEIKPKGTYSSSNFTVGKTLPQPNNTASVAPDSRKQHPSPLPALTPQPQPHSGRCD